MLPGGAAVIGVYAFCDKAAFDALTKNHEQAPQHREQLLLDGASEA